MNHEYGNIVLQHLILNGDRQHRITIARAALDSLKLFVETSEAGQWFASNLVQMCAFKMADNAFFRAQMMEVILKEDCHALPKLRKENKFMVSRILQMASQSERKTIKACVRGVVDHCLCEAKLNLGFKSSLLTRTWASLGASAEKEIDLANVKPQTIPCHPTEEACFQMILYALPIPPKCANCSFQNLDLHGKFHLLPIAMETEEGVSIDLSADTELVKGATLWCTFKPCSHVQTLVHNFLGKAPRSLRSRCVQLPRPPGL